MQPTPLRKVVGTYSVIRGEWFLSAESRVVASRQLIVVFTCRAMSHAISSVATEPQTAQFIS